MRFSSHQQTLPSDPSRDRVRRKARFLGDLKGELRGAANAAGLTLSDLARLIGRNKSTVSRTLDPSTNIEAFTLFEIADALGKEWVVKLKDRERDLGVIFDNGNFHPTHPFNRSWSPVVGAGNGRKETEAVPAESDMQTDADWVLEDLS